MKKAALLRRRRAGLAVHSMRAAACQAILVRTRLFAVPLSSTANVTRVDGFQEEGASVSANISNFAVRCLQKVIALAADSDDEVRRELVATDVAVEKRRVDGNFLPLLRHCGVADPPGGYIPASLV